MQKPEEGLTDPNFKPKAPYINLYSDMEGGSLHLSPKLVADKDGYKGQIREKIPENLVLTQCDAGNPAGVANLKGTGGTTSYNLGEVSVEKGDLRLSLHNLDNVSTIGYIQLDSKSAKKLADDLYEALK